ncbi:MAG: endolytic transglycosylase MltG [Proteobacteria bacterium]|nr:endolytic transglycosylase MltG [Pseudomonadota bacterium]
MKRALVLLTACILIIVSTLAGYGGYLVSRPIQTDPGDRYIVRPGATLYGVTDDLVNKGIVDLPPSMFRGVGLITGLDDHLKAGEYDISTVMTPLQLLSLLRSGNVIVRRMTFPEGWQFADWRRALGSEVALEHHSDHLSDLDLMAQLGMPRMAPEGWFFPDTYVFTLGDSDMEILERAHRRMLQLLEREWLDRDRSEGEVRSRYDALILASIVEKESGVAEDRDKIARVFLNRLQRGMKLQSDPTVIYGMGTTFDGDLTRRDLMENTPYNTYVHHGLPPTPIAMPGLGAIRAVLNPSPDDHLYFVARGDGTSHFSNSLAEHNMAVERFQRSGRVPQYRSSPLEEQSQ